MRTFWLILLVAVFASCKNSAESKKDIDSLGSEVKKKVNDALNSEIADSIKAKGDKIVEDVKTKSAEIWDSTKAKVEKGGKELNKLTKKDSGKSK